MAFGKRSQGGLVAAIRNAKAETSRRRLMRTALAGLVLGFGGVTAGTGFVQASERGGIFDFFGQLFGVPQTRQEPVAAAKPEAQRTRKRYASLPDARRVSSVRPRPFTPRPVQIANGSADPKARTRGPMAAAPAQPAQPASGTRTVCVRTCDGYVFPLGLLRAPNDVPVHQAACAAACPTAPTALFTLNAGRTELEQAVSLKGQPYLAAAWANVYRNKRVENCHCQPPGVAAGPMPFEHDLTMRVGDVIATGKSAAVVTRHARGGVRLEDYRSARGISSGQRRDIESRIGSIRREADERAFQRALRTADADVSRLRMAEAKITRMRLSEAETDSGIAAPVPTARQGFAPVRVLVPAPFVH